jgi:hypothetical protein
MKRQFGKVLCSKIAGFRSTSPVVLFFAILSGVVNAQPAPKQFEPFNTFIANTRVATISEFSSKADSKVKDAQSFEEMRQHILSLYHGVEVSHSFVLDSEQFDCVPVAQQPGLRAQNSRQIAQAPPLSAIRSNAQSDKAGKAVELTSQIGPDQQFDESGNAIGCSDNTIPMRRVTLEQMSHFANLQDFFKKGAGSDGQAPKPENHQPQAPDGTHKYAYTYQYVNNLGGNSSINLWSPYVYSGEIFSLGQQWYVGGNQTAEVGMQNYPGYYGGENSKLFIYWTADGYQNTGCYNLTCGAFVQTNGNWYFGAGFSNYSVWGGAQYEFSAQYYLYQGNWWLALGGQWVGYYPGSIYRGGQLTRYATLIEFGGETDGYNPWPPMGSGGWAGWGWTYAAYQRNVYYRDLSAITRWTSLTTVQPSSNCFTTAGPYWSNSSGWGIYFYYGGPGGYNCY